MVAMSDNELAFTVKQRRAQLVAGWLTHEFEQGRLGSALMLGTISTTCLPMC